MLLSFTRGLVLQCYSHRIHGLQSLLFLRKSGISLVIREKFSQNLLLPGNHASFQIFTDFLSPILQTIPDSSILRVFHMLLQVLMMDLMAKAPSIVALPNKILSSAKKR
ncbi:hypothetical protein V6Z12_D02G170900 [Gossypium hirsutum]